MKIELFFDGGCAPNPGAKYGSYEVIIDGKPKHKESRQPLGHGTNNEAEFEILIVALERVSNYIERRGVDKKEVEISMTTDSTIVANRISGKNKRGLNALAKATNSEMFSSQVQKISPKKEAERRMAALSQMCLDILVSFKSFQIQWRQRNLNVSKFGH
jgi:ribonuclease HI